MSPEPIFDKITINNWHWKPYFWTVCYNHTFWGDNSFHISWKSMTKKFAITNFWWSILVNDLFCTVLLHFKQSFCHCKTKISKHPPGAVLIWPTGQLSETKGLKSTDVGPQMMPKYSFIGFFRKRDPQNTDTQAERYKKCTFPILEHFKNFKTVQTF